MLINFNKIKFNNFNSFVSKINSKCINKTLLETIFEFKVYSLNI